MDGLVLKGFSISGNYETKEQVRNYMKKIELTIVALSHSVTQSHNYAVVLGETDGPRRLPIVIGGPEAQAIAVALERMTPNRPLTHDLFKQTLDTFDIVLKEVVINNLLDGVFYSKLICIKNGETFEIDSRTSDALAMAVRFQCPIFSYEFILDAAGVVLEQTDEDENEEDTNEPIVESGDLSDLSLPELKELLEETLSKENYEEAAKIRDEINRRKTS